VSGKTAILFSIFINRLIVFVYMKQV